VPFSFATNEQQRYHQTRGRGSALSSRREDLRGRFRRAQRERPNFARSKGGIMFTFWGKRENFCDGVTRRGFLQIGAFGAGLTLAEMLRLRAAAGGTKASARAAIMIYLPGGPSHMDMYDLKPDAPKEFRGEFKPIATNVPGVQVCEH